MKRALALIFMFLAYSCTGFAQGISPVPRLQFLDNNGKPAANYRLCTYDAGTSTPTYTYSDYARTTANTNPIVLDTAGRPTSNGTAVGVFLDAKAYKFVLSTAGTPDNNTSCPTDGAVIWTQDNVDAPGFVSLAHVSSMTFATSPWADVTSPTYGAVCNGTTNDATAIQAAVDAMALVSGEVFIPAKTCKITSPIAMKSGVKIRGVGAKFNDIDGSVIYAPSSHAFTIGEGITDIEISDLAIYAKTPGTGYLASKYGISMTGAAPNSSFRMKFSNLRISNFERGISVVGDGSWQCDGVDISHLWLNQNLHGIYIKDARNADYWKIDHGGCSYPSIGGDCFSFQQAGFAWIRSFTGGGSSYDAWAIDTAYTVGDTVTNNNKTYECITSGTSAHSGGPTGRTSDITDNTAHWKYVAGSAFIRFGAPNDQLLVTGSQAEQIEYFLDVSSSVATTYLYPVALRDNVINSIVSIDRALTYISDGNVYTASPEITGADVRISSFNDQFDTAIDFSISGSNSKVVSRVDMAQAKTKFLSGSSIVDMENGEIGVGTATPDWPITVVKDGTYDDGTGPGLYIKDEDVAMFDVGLGLGVDSANNVAYVQANSGGAYDRNIVLQPNGGKVAINHISPTETLDVYGNVLIQSAVAPTLKFADTAGTTIAGGVWRLMNDSNTLTLDMNTAAEGDFSTSKNKLAVEQYSVTLPAPEKVADKSSLIIGTPFYTTGSASFIAQRNWAVGDGTAATYGLMVQSKQAPGSKNQAAVYGSAYAEGAGVYTGSYYFGGIFRASTYDPNGYENATTISRVSGVYADVVHSSDPATATIAAATGYRASLWQDEGGTTTDYRAYDVRSDQATSGTIGTYTGFYYDALPAGSTTTHEYGAYIEAPTRGSTTNIGIYNGGTQTQVGALTLGVAGSTAGSAFLTNTTSGSVELATVTGALGTSKVSFPADTGTLCVIKAATALSEGTDIVTLDYSAQATACSPSFTLVPTDDDDGFTLGALSNCAAHKKGLIYITNPGAVEAITYNATYWQRPGAIGTDGAALSAGASELTILGFVCDTATHARIVSINRDTDP